MDKELINKVTFKIPNALVLVGAADGEEWNGMTTSWVSQLSQAPVLIGISVDNDAVTHRLITAGQAFSVNLWSSEDTRVFVRFSKPATREGNALNGRPVRVGKTGVPIFDDAIAWMECRVVQSHDMGSHTLFVGEIVDAGVEDDDVRAAALSDTRLKYGGVRRPGHG